MGVGHSGDLTANFAPLVGNLTPRFVKSPVFPHPPPGVGGGGGVGHEIDKCIIVAKHSLLPLLTLSLETATPTSLLCNKRL